MEKHTEKEVNTDSKAANNFYDNYEDESLSAEDVIAMTKKIMEKYDSVFRQLAEESDQQ